MICKYEKTIYSNHENGFGIYVFTTKDKSVPADARTKKGKETTFTGKGYSIPESNGIDLDLSGKWIKGSYGLQFEIEKCISIMPKSEDGIIGYLSSGLIRGVGPATAKQIVAKFGVKTYEVLEQKSEELLSIKGITKENLKILLESYQKNKDYQEIITQLSPFGITPKKASKIQEQFQARALDVVLHNTFELCGISGFGFLTVDDIAYKMGCDLNSPLRVRGALHYALQEAGQEGHLYLPANELVEAALKVLNKKGVHVIRETVQTETKRLCSEDILVADKGCVYLPEYYNYEDSAARGVSELLVSHVKLIKELDRWIGKAQVKLNIELSEKQKESVKMCLSNMVSIITGGPGTGKTTVLKVILYIYQQTEKGQILLMAPTGRASRQMAESTGFSSCSTVHSALGLFKDKEYGEGEREINADFVILDEASMADMFISSHIFSRLKKGARILLVGDVDQLPSVGPGNVFRELIECDLIPVVRLDLVYRQSANSQIPFNAQKINAGDTRLIYGEEFQMREIQDEVEAANIVLDEFEKAVQEYGIDNVQILCPMRKRGGVSANALNEIIRGRINPHKVNLAEAKAGRRIFRVHDKIMHLKNKEDLNNGDIGYVTGIDLKNEKFTLTFSDNRQVCYGTEEMDRVQLAYAVTIHKSQGTECSVVISPFTMGAYIMLKRNLIYTAVTRGKQKVILIGQAKAVAMAIQRNDIDQRNTRLGERIKKYWEEELRHLKRMNEKIEPQKQQLTL